ncbi:hypothetical protein HKD37_19G054470 [Glycine soja]
MKGVNSVRVASVTGKNVGREFLLLLFFSFLIAATSRFISLSPSHNKQTHFPTPFFFFLCNSLSSCVFKIVTQTAPSPLRFLSHVYQVGSPLSIPYSDVYSFPCFCENFADDHTLSLSLAFGFLVLFECLCIVHYYLYMF